MNENIPLTEAVYYILLSLTEPLHGYGIMQNAAKLSCGRVNLAAGTLYGALTTMLERGWIENHGEVNARKKEYKITPAGEAILKNELTRLRELVNNGEKILGS
ncbi:MAG: helix-turn-helix transcriptional regulator [Defluviitaleaceae bacterium]|nr:helix-turn-helix transcriptional regulator [Defluviitaleaceae bacterium]